MAAFLQRRAGECVPTTGLVRTQGCSPCACYGLTSQGTFWKREKMLPSAGACFVRENITRSIDRGFFRELLGRARILGPAA